jgi:hypothetical protein
MKRVAGILALGVSNFFASASLSATPTLPEADVVVLALRSLEIPDRIPAVFWTRRKADFTLQIVRRTKERPRQNPATGLSNRSASTVQVWEPLQVWLLTRDGTQIPPTRTLPPVGPTKKWCTGSGPLPTECWDYEFLYSFPLSVGAESVAVVLKVGDVHLIETVPSFPQ